MRAAAGGRDAEAGVRFRAATASAADVAVAAAAAGAVILNKRLCRKHEQPVVAVARGRGARQYSRGASLTLPNEPMPSVLLSLYAPMRCADCGAAPASADADAEAPAPPPPPPPADAAGAAGSVGGTDGAAADAIQGNRLRQRGGRGRPAAR